MIDKDFFSCSNKSRAEKKKLQLVFRVFFDFWLYDFIWHKFVYNENIDWNKREPLFWTYKNETGILNCKNSIKPYLIWQRGRWIFLLQIPTWWEPGIKIGNVIPVFFLLQKIFDYEFWSFFCFKICFRYVFSHYSKCNKKQA